MSTSPTHPVKGTPLSVSDNQLLSEQTSPKVLAPKVITEATTNVTADTNDVKSVISDDSILNTSAQSLVNMFAAAMTNIIKDVRELPVYMDQQQDPTNIGSQTSVSKSSTTSVHAPSQTKVAVKHSDASSQDDPVVANPKLTSTSTLATNKSGQYKQAAGPPLDPVEFEKENFASRKSFHGIDSTTSRPHLVNPSYSSTRDEVHMVTEHPVYPTTFVQPSAPTFSDGIPSVSTAPEHQIDVPDRNVEYHNEGSEFTPPDHRDPFLAPKVSYVHHHTETAQDVPRFSPKPMITFDMAKWTREIKDVTIKDESFDSIIAWYDTIQTSFVIATGRGDIMPELENLSRSFSFASHVLPPKSSSVYKAGYIQYVSMAKALRLHIVHPVTIASCCSVLLQKRDTYQHDKDGFVLLMQMLSGVFPHLGGPHLDIVKEIGSINASKSETFNSIYKKFIQMSRKLHLSGHHVPATALFQRYMDIVKINDRAFTLVSPIHRLFDEHLRLYGPDIVFPRYSIPEVHSYLRSSGVQMDSIIAHSTIRSKPSFAQTHAAFSVVPQASAAYEQHDQLPYRCIVDPQAHAAAMAAPTNPTFEHRGRHQPCPVCFQRHPVLHCWSRGPKFQPLWLQRNAAKYNSLHPNDVVEDSYKSQAPPLRFANRNYSPQANKSVSFTPTSTDIVPVPTKVPTDISLSGAHLSQVTAILPPPRHDDATILSEPECHESVFSPECHMAHDEIFPSKNEESSFIEA